MRSQTRSGMRSDMRSVMKSGTRSGLGRGALLIALIGLASAPLDAQTPVTAGAAVPPGTTTHVRLQSGSVVLTGWDRDSVHVSGLLAPGESWVIRQEGDTVRLRAEGMPRGLSAPSELEIFVPRSANLVVRAAAASMVVREFDQDVDVATAAGNLLVELVGGAVRAETMQGTLTIVGTNPRVVASTASGEMIVSVPYDTIGTSVVLAEPADAASGISGFGEVTLRSVSGSIEFNAPSVAGGLVQNVRGPTRVIAEPAAGGTLRVASHVGLLTFGWRDEAARSAAAGGAVATPRVDARTQLGGTRGQLPASWASPSAAAGVLELRNVRGDIAYERWEPPTLP